MYEYLKLDVFKYFLIFHFAQNIGIVLLQKLPMLILE